jgi:hypothetical protein
MATGGGAGRIPAVADDEVERGGRLEQLWQLGNPLGWRKGVGSSPVGFSTTAGIGRCGSSVRSRRGGGDWSRSGWRGSPG